MFEDFFGMKYTPFTRNVPPERLYESASIANILGRLGYVADRQLFAVLTSDAGCGKSTMIRKFADSLSRDEYILLYLSDSKLTPSWLYKGMLRQLGLEPKFYRSEAKDQLQNEIRRIRANDRKKIVCVLDEAHLLDKETLEEFRFLLNFEFDSTSPMALILVGQTELWVEKLRLQRYAAIRQRIDVNCVIPHLDRAETERYVRSHLEYAEGLTEIFTMKALDVIAKESAGIPRVINRICEKSLMYAFQLQRKLVDDYMVNFVPLTDRYGAWSDSVRVSRTEPFCDRLWEQ